MKLIFESKEFDWTLPSPPAHEPHLPLNPPFVMFCVQEKLIWHYIKTVLSLNAIQMPSDKAILSKKIYKKKKKKKKKDEWK